MKTDDLSFMSKKYCVFALILLMIGAANIRIVLATAQTGNQVSSTDEIKRAVAKAGTGRKARIKVTLRDNTEIEGYVNEARENDFVLTDKKTKNPMTALYADASKIKKDKFSKAAKIGIGIGIGVAAYVVVLAIITEGFTKKIID